MKRIIIVFLTALLLLSYAGCGPLTKMPQSSSQAATVENRVALSIDKTVYEKEERVEVTLDFDKLNKDTAVIVIVSSDTAHGKEAYIHDDGKHEEYRWLADFSELPFYMQTPNKDGLFDVRVYSDGEGGDELASVTFSVGNTTPPAHSAESIPAYGSDTNETDVSQQGGQTDNNGWPFISYLNDGDKYTGDGIIVRVHEWEASAESEMWTVYYSGASFAGVESYVEALVSAGWTNNYADEDGNYIETETEKGTARAYYCTCDYAEAEIQVADFSNTMNFTGEPVFTFNLSIQFSRP